MRSGVNPKRRYDSPRRREQAKATREAILEAAQRLFERHGYAATTMAAIAAEAKVATKTVYLAFETKSGVLRSLWNLRLRAGRDDLPIAGQEWYREVLEESDPERQLRLNARNSRETKLRIATVLEVVQGAAPLDPEIAALWDRIQTEFHGNQRVIVASVAEKGALKTSLDVERGADLLWAINHPSLWNLLVGRRSWSAEDYERWTADLACSQLLE